VSVAEKGPEGQAGVMTALKNILAEANLPVLLAVLVLLGTGGVLRARLLGQRSTFADRGIGFEYPKSWVAKPVPLVPGSGVEAAAEVTNLWASSAVKPHVSFKVERLPDSADPALALDYVAVNLGRDLPLLHLLGQRSVKVGSLNAVRYQYVYAVDPAPGAYASDIPVIVEAADLVLVRDRSVITVGVAAPRDEFEANRPRYEAILASVTPR
jgi:hypothetical protein